MAVEDSSTVDGLGFRASDSQLELVIYDQLDWSDEDAHLETLTNKLNGYMVFLNSGQVSEIFPDAEPSAFETPWIRTVFENAPTENGVAFLKGLADQLRPHGLMIAYDLAGDEPRTSFTL